MRFTSVFRSSLTALLTLVGVTLVSPASADSGDNVFADLGLPNA